MFVYFAIILCHQGTQVLNLEYTATAKHSAFLALKFINHCPPAGSFKISKRLIKSTEITRLLNQGV
jgi:hypothetical protein